MSYTDYFNQYLLRRIEFIFIIGIVLIYCWATYERNFVWKDEFSLWSDVVKKSPDKARGYNEVGMCYYERKMPDKAIPFFKKSLSLNPDYDIAHNNLGLCFLGKGLINQAVEEFREAIRLKPLNGMYHINLGIAYWQNGLSNMAYREIELGKALRRKSTPNRPSYHHGVF
jgi:tetratricopeptide (TPR) repeat protein